MGGRIEVCGIAMDRSAITSDTTVKLDNVFSSMELTVPDNIPVVIDSQGAFGSLSMGQ